MIEKAGVGNIAWRQAGPSPDFRLLMSTSADFSY